MMQHNSESLDQYRTYAFTRKIVRELGVTKVMLGKMYLGKQLIQNVHVLGVLTWVEYQRISEKRNGGPAAAFWARGAKIKKSLP